MSKINKNERRALALKRARRNKILLILACIAVVAGISAAVVFGVDWEAWNNPNHSNHVGCTPDNC
jgi:hypothetical protein